MKSTVVAGAVALVVMGLGLAGCSKKPSGKSGQGSPEASASAAASSDEPGRALPSAAASANADPITVATFSVEKFDSAKAGKPDILKALAGVVKKYDVLAVQGIKDDTDAVAQALLREANQGARGAYGLVVSEPTGREKNDEHWRERYAFYYRKSRIDAYDEGKLYDDSADDDFPREPFAARFGVRGAKLGFVLITIRTDAKRTLKELAQMPKVIAWAKEAFPEDEKLIVLGDFNGDCRHATPEQLEKLDLRTAQYQWVVPDDADTNVGEASCAYDRIVLTEPVFRDYLGQWGVDRAFTDEAVSNRWPVWAKFRTDRHSR